MKSTPLNNVFTSVQIDKPTTSTFDLSFDHKTSLKMGNLVPINLMEIIPGDKISLNSEGMYRLMPMLAPIMHKVDVTIHHFFVPNRLTWKNWETWITNGNGDGKVAATFPTFDLGAHPIDVPASSLANYLGLPVSPIGHPFGDGDCNALPFAAYFRVWFDWYRDQNLSKINVTLPQPDDFPYLQDGSQTATMQNELLFMRKRAWEHDMFTSALPFVQKGQAVDIPIDLLGSLDVLYEADTLLTGSYHKPGTYGTAAANGAAAFDTGQIVDIGGQRLNYDPNHTMYIDASLPGTKSGFTMAGTINDLRAAMQLQKWLEVNARAGSRYIEHIQAHFDVRPSDYRLQRSQYLGGTKCSIAVSEVLQTSATVAPDTPQGNMAGHGIAISAGDQCSAFFEEHGFMLSILSITPRTSYYQGLPKLFRKTTGIFDYAYPKFAALGEVPLYKEELFFNHVDNSQGREEFGYLPMYYEYRINPSRVSGQMATTLDYWHMARKFDPDEFPIGVLAPQLNQGFIECTPDKRIFADTDPDADEIVAHIIFMISANRRLPYYGSPGGI